MLTYAFDLLYAIYEEQGYDATEIPELILKNNLYGIEIDERAGSLAAFALSMKARDKNRRFLEKNIQPNICVLENISFTDEELAPYRKELGQDLFSQPLLQTLGQFAEANNFGSLIQPAMENPLPALEELERKDFTNDLFLQPIHQNIIKALTQADYLSQKYHVVIANPPYMGGNGMNPRLGAWLKDNYIDSKSDLFAAFIERGFELVLKNGYSAMVTMQSWMFLSSYEKLRNKLLAHTTIETMTHMGNMVMGIAFGTSATVWKNALKEDYKGQFSYVAYDDLNEYGVPIHFPIKNERYKKASSADFKKIPGSPIAYWASEYIRNVFDTGNFIINPKVGLQSGNNDLYIRSWWEIQSDTTALTETEHKPTKRWFPFNKGGEYRKWYGNRDLVIDWANNGQAIRNDIPKAVVRNQEYYFSPSITCSAITSGEVSYRYYPAGGIFDVNMRSMFFNSETELIECLSLLSSNTANFLSQFLSQTMALNVDDLKRIPVTKPKKQEYLSLTETLIRVCKSDWDAYETSWDFESLPLFSENHITARLDETYRNLRDSWQEMTDEMKRLEEENNRIFIDAYGLQDELTPDVPLEEITLTCNPYYRYGGKNTPEELEAKLLSDTMQEFIHYAVGCMFGRYSIDKPGLILANQGDTIAEYKAQVYPIENFGRGCHLLC